MKKLESMPQIDDLPPIRDIIKSHGLTAKKSLGQNFLHDLNLTTKIANSAGDLSNQNILEIGPGLGALTRAILANNVKSLLAIEKDIRCVNALKYLEKVYPQQLKVINCDAVTMETDLIPNLPVKIISNLPFNVSTALLTKWISIEPWPPWWSTMTLMFQKEVADRIIAAPNNKSYGRLSVAVGWRTKVTKLFDLDPKAFTPPPKVWTTVLHFEPKVQKNTINFKNLEKVTAAAFGQRRKMLRTSLKTLSVNTQQLLLDCGLDDTKRAENISVDDYANLTSSYQNQLS